MFGCIRDIANPSLILGPIDRMSKGVFTMQFPLSTATRVTDEGAEREGASLAR